MSMHQREVRLWVDRGERLGLWVLSASASVRKLGEFLERVIRRSRRALPEEAPPAPLD